MAIILLGGVVAEKGVDSDGDSENRYEMLTPGGSGLPEPGPDGWAVRYALAQSSLRLEGGKVDVVPIPALATPTLVPDMPTPTATETSQELGGLAGTLGSDGLAAVICSYSWDCGEALAVAECESGLRPDAISYNGTSFGTMQIWGGHASRWPAFWETWMEAEVNIGWAYELYLESGWAPWRESVGCHGAW